MSEIIDKNSTNTLNDPRITPVRSEGLKSPENGASDLVKGRDGYPGTGISSPTAAGGSRISRKQLLELEPTLSDRDWKILRTIRLCRVILGRQLGRLYFTEGRTENANTTATNRRLKALSDMGLITHLNEKVNCRLKGYVAYIYYLTEAGERILQIHLCEGEYRKRNLEPAFTTLTHTLSAVECLVQTVEACRADDMRLGEIELEPDCWRPYTYNLKDYILKPDLALVTEKQDWSDHSEPWFEYRWLNEVDLNTESIQTILEKCRRYFDYYRSEAEQRENGCFPLVVWIVKTESRRQSIMRHLCEAFPKFPRIFAVILPDEYTKLIRDELSVEGCICQL